MNSGCLVTYLRYNRLLTAALFCQYVLWPGFRSTSGSFAIVDAGFFQGGKTLPKPKYDKYEKKGKQKKGTSATSHNDAPEATVEV